MRLPFRRVAALTLLVTSRVWATTPEDAALAEELFRDGKQKMADNHYAEACPKLAESQRLDPGGGTLLTLALCHEAEGRTAAAWAEFGDALAMAKRDARDDRERIAREHVDALAPRLRRIRIHVAKGEDTLNVAKGEDTLTVRRDGAELGPPAWDVAAPVDAGEHVVEASSPGFVDFRAVIMAPAEGSTLTLSVPPLARVRNVDAEKPRSRPKEQTSAAKTGSAALRIAAYAAGAVSVVSFGAAGYFALHAKSQRDAANEACPSVSCGDPNAVATSHDAGRSADFATASVGVAVVTAATAIALYILSGSEPGARAGASAGWIGF